MAADGYDTRELAALLEWYVENGVDLALDDSPHDRYADSLNPPQDEIQRPTPARLPTAPKIATSAPKQSPALLAPDGAALAAADLVATAQTIDELAASLAGFEHAPHRALARHFLFSAGATGAKVMALDTAPGETEETSGVPFCGREALLLDNMLRAIGLDRKTAYLSYFSPWRPPGSMALTPQQSSVLAPFARRHIVLASPELLLIFGEAPARAILQTGDPMTAMRGRVHDVRLGELFVRTFVFPALSSLLQSSAFKPRVWQDLRVARTLVGI